MISKSLLATVLGATVILVSCNADAPNYSAKLKKGSGNAVPETNGEASQSEEGEDEGEPAVGKPTMPDDGEPEQVGVPPIVTPIPMPDPTPTPTPTPMPENEAEAIKKKCTPQAEFISDNSAGAKKFLMYVPDPKLAMIQAAQYICSVLYKKASEVPPVTKVTLKLDTHGGVAQASGPPNNKLIQFDTNYINGIGGNVKLELDGVLIHEGTHLWQWSSNGTDGGFIEGIADYVRAGGAWYPAGSRNNKSNGQKYNDAYTTSAYFIGWVDSKYPGFGHAFNLAQKAWPGVSVFKTFTGKDVDSLWNQYRSEGTFSPKSPEWVAKAVPLQLGK